MSAESLGPQKPHIGATASRSEQNHLVWLRSATLHPGRANRHPGNRKPRCIWLFSKEPLEGGCRNMSFDKIPADLRRMTGRQIRWYAKPRLHRVEVRRLDSPHV